MHSRRQILGLATAALAALDTRMPPVYARVDGIVTPIDDHTCLLELASDSLDLVSLVVGMLDVDFDIESPPELAQHLRKLSDRFANAATQQ